MEVTASDFGRDCTAGRPYHNGWLRLTRPLRKLFLPYGEGAYPVKFFHHFGGEEQFFTAYVDSERGEIVGKNDLYDALYGHGIYAGAKLVIRHRVSLTEYDLSVIKLSAPKMVLVRRVEFDEEGRLCLANRRSQFRTK